MVNKSIEKPVEEKIENNTKNKLKNKRTKAQHFYLVHMREREREKNK